MAYPLRSLPAALIALLLAGCASVPPLDPHERFKVSCRKGDPGECIIKVKALFDPPFPLTTILRGTTSLVEGRVALEIEGWKGRPDYPGEEPGMVEIKVGCKLDAAFAFRLMYLGHEDDYAVFVPANGPPRIDPAAGEFSERD